MRHRILIAAVSLGVAEALWHRYVRAILCSRLGVAESHGFWPRSTEGKQ